MQRLTKLHDLEIGRCPRLEERCAKDSGPEWPKISHIPHLSFVQGCVSSHCVQVLSTHTVLLDQFYGSDNETCVGTLVMGRTGFSSEELRIVGG
ncbi:hypothetical protein EV2_027179 [Malus domestica]